MIEDEYSPTVYSICVSFHIHAIRFFSIIEGQYSQTVYSTSVSFHIHAARVFGIIGGQYSLPVYSISVSRVSVLWKANTHFLFIPYLSAFIFMQSGFSVL